MALTTLIARSRAAWEDLARAPAAFTPFIQVAVSPKSRICRPGWIGIVVIEDAAIATAPNQRTARTVQGALSTVPATSLTDITVLSGKLHIAEMVGPASLAYLDASDFRPQQNHTVTEPLQPEAPELRQFLAACDPAEVEESGMQEITSTAFIVREQEVVVAAAGYRDWPGRVAHLSVLTATCARGLGLGRTAAAGAVAHAISQGKLPQWRARLEPSRRVARALGFHELGSQASIRLHPGP